MWRPKSWVNTYWEPFNDAFEAGASAMLKVLREQPDTFHTSSLQLAEFCKKHKGWMAFIPEEK